MTPDPLLALDIHLSTAERLRLAQIEHHKSRRKHISDTLSQGEPPHSSNALELLPSYPHQAALEYLTPQTLDALLKLLRRAAQSLYQAVPATTSDDVSIPDLVLGPKWEEYQTILQGIVPGTPYTASTLSNYVCRFGGPSVDIVTAVLDGSRAITYEVNPYYPTPRADVDFHGWLQSNKKIIDDKIKKLELASPQFVQDHKDLFLEFTSLELVDPQMEKELEDLKSTILPKVADKVRSRVEETVLEPVTGPIYDITRPFGAELEVIFPEPLRQSDKVDIIKRLFERLGIQTGPDYTTWQVAVDGSVKNHHTLDDGSGLEIISPPLCGAQGQQEYRRVIEALRAVGVRVNSTCGAHFHLSAPDYVGVRGWEYQKRLVKNYAANEETIRSFLPPERVKNFFGGRVFTGPRRDVSMPILKQFVAASKRVIARRPNSISPALSLDHVDVMSKGASVLMHGLTDSKQTLEFRQLPGHLDPDYGLAWLETMDRMVNWSVAREETISISHDTQQNRLHAPAQELTTQSKRLLLPLISKFTSGATLSSSPTRATSSLMAAKAKRLLGL